jgi:hypothetical protein
MACTHKDLNSFEVLLLVGAFRRNAGRSVCTTMLQTNGLSLRFHSLCSCTCWKPHVCCTLAGTSTYRGTLPGKVAGAITSILIW